MAFEFILREPTAPDTFTVVICIADLMILENAFFIEDKGQTEPCIVASVIPEGHYQVRRVTRIVVHFISLREILPLSWIPNGLDNYIEVVHAS